MAEPTLTTTATETISNAPQVWPYVWTVLLSAWGGTVSYIQSNKKTGKPFNWRELAFDITISSFAGILTHFFCQAASIDGAMQAMMVAISGHMGTRAIASFAGLYERILGKKE